MLLRDLDQVTAAIRQFLASSRKPALMEPGDDQIVLGPDNYVLDRKGDRLFLQAWDARRNVSRRVTGIEQEKRGELQLTIERFGRREGTLMLLDLGRPRHLASQHLGARLRFREQFRRFLLREFASWTVADLTSEQDLEDSLSPAYSRAFVRKGTQAWAAIGAPPAAAADGALAFGLIWLDYLRRRERKATLEGLAIFVPAGSENTTCLRLRWLNSQTAQFALFVYSGEGFEDRVDPQDHGNLATALDPHQAEVQSDQAQWIQRMKDAPAAETVERGDGALSFRIRGLEFARLDHAGLRFGIDAKRRAQESNWSEILALASHLERMRTAGNGPSQNPLYLRNPELWLESQVRAHLDQLDASLLPAPVYGQVPTFTAGDRGVVDLLAAGYGGRLAVIELKATQDLQLPLQALDYWMRVRHHVQAGDFPRLAYFPTLSLTAENPRLLLVAPALEFHPTSETLLRYFHPEVEVERIGLGMNWRSDVKVVFRVRGAQRPG